MHAKKDLVGGVGFLLLGLWGMEESLRLPLGSWQRPEPGFFPLLLSLFLVAMTLVLLITASKKQASAPRGGPSTHPRKIWWTLVSLLMYYLVLEPMGFLISSFLILLFLLRVIAVQSWRVTLGVSTGAALTSYLLFDRLLKLPLPRGLIGF